MARVNHKRVKQLITQEKNKYSDQQFFTSPLFTNYLQEIATTQTGRFSASKRVSVKVVWEPDNEGYRAATDNRVIWINAGHKTIKNLRNREERFEDICGLFAHELAHVLFTDFLGKKACFNGMAHQKWYPDSPDVSDPDYPEFESDFWAFCQEDEESLQAAQMMVSELHNILEDGHIEQRMMYEYPGVLGGNLKNMRDRKYAGMLTVTQMIEMEHENAVPTWSTIAGIILGYVLFGEIKYGDTAKTDERIVSVFGLILDLDHAVATCDAKERWRVVNHIIFRCWPYLREYLSYLKEYSLENMDSGMPSLSGTVTAIPVGEMNEAEDSEDEIPVEAGKRDETAEDAAAFSSGNPSESDEESPASKTENSADMFGNELSALSAKPYQDVSEEETGRIPFEQTNDLSVPEGGGVKRDDDYECAGYPHAARDMDRVLENMATKTIHEKLEKENTLELNELAQGISYSNIHHGVKISVHRMATVSESMIEDYNKVALPVLDISRNLEKNIQRHLFERKNGGKQTGMISGRRIHAPSIARTDARLFSKMTLPSDTPELAVGLLVDESGSMSSADRITYARLAAIILEDFCRRTGTSIMICGHEASNDVKLYCYADFDGIDGKDRYRLMDISARTGNRDGAAIRFVAEQLVKRVEQVKLLLIISDGQPAASGYYGSAAEDDLRGIKQEYQRKGVTFITAAIGDDKGQISRIYGDSFLDISDLKRLPVLLTNLVKKRLV